VKTLGTGEKRQPFHSLPLSGVAAFILDAYLLDR
jgi:hypothetical protein